MQKPETAPAQPGRVRLYHCERCSDRNGCIESVAPELKHPHSGLRSNPMRRRDYAEPDLYDPAGRYGDIRWFPIAVVVVCTFLGWGLVTNAAAGWLSATPAAPLSDADVPELPPPTMVCRTGSSVSTIV